MTHVELYAMVGRIAHRPHTSSGYLAELKDAVKAAINEASAYAPWWFAQVELRIPLVAGAAGRLYSFPTTDQQGETIAIASLNKKTWRTKANSHLEWITPQDASRDDPDWTDAAAAGTVNYVGITGSKLFLYKNPSAEYVADNVYLYGHGWRMWKLPADDVDGATPDGCLAWDAEIDCPREWHPALVSGVLKWAYKQGRSDRWRDEEGLFRNGLKEMLARCLPAEGLGVDAIPPADVFGLDGGGDARLDRRNFGQ